MRLTGAWMMRQLRRRWPFRSQLAQLLAVALAGACRRRFEKVLLVPARPGFVSLFRASAASLMAASASRNASATLLRRLGGHVTKPEDESEGLIDRFFGGEARGDVVVQAHQALRLKKTLDQRLAPASTQLGRVRTGPATFQVVLTPHKPQPFSSSFVRSLGVAKRALIKRTAEHRRRQTRTSVDVARRGVNWQAADWRGDSLGQLKP